MGLAVSESALVGNSPAFVRVRGRNGPRLRSRRMTPVPPAHDRRSTVRAVRRLRDMIRTAIQRDGYIGGQLPSEAELMAAHRVTRATVREALAMLRADGLIARTQGIGTHAVVSTIVAGLAESHGAVAPVRNGLLDRRMRPRVLDRSHIPAPGTVAERLGVPVGTDCLRLAYVGLVEDEPLMIATNYVLFPEAGRRLGGLVSDKRRGSRAGAHRHPPRDGSRARLRPGRHTWP